MTSEVQFLPPPAWRLSLRKLGRHLREWMLLTRLNRPIGIWLLLWPTLWALWIAGAGHPRADVFLVFVLGTVLMRSAGCVINDFADRNIDPQVKRTRERPLAARRISPYEALILFAVLALSSLLLVLQLNALTIKLSFVGAALTVSYPFFKRFFPAPQFYLGVAFSWGVIMAFAAQLGVVPRVAITIFLTSLVWAAVYDTQYAMVDRDDDLKIGVKSTAILFGDMDRVVVGLLQLMVLFGLFVAGRSVQLGLWYMLGLAAAALFFGWQQWLMRNRDRDDCFRAFLNNNYVGMAVFIGLALSYVFKS
jgi:4-hydroxybenzoate polyprenyltransferase